MYNQNFYNNFRPNEFTFQNTPPPNFVPPPPAPPVFFIHPTRPSDQHILADQNFVKQFENVAPVTQNKQKSQVLSINKVKQDLYCLVSQLNTIKEREKMLTQNLETLSDDEWKSTMQEIANIKVEITESLGVIDNTYLETLRNLLDKRASKRLRMKKIKRERQREKEILIKESKERSRKIDENLQKIQDVINKAKQEEEAKLKADIVLKDVLRKKLDAKKCINKLDAFIKLRTARQNTAKGRGENTSEREAEIFTSSIDKLKSLWAHKLSVYDKEEAELSLKLKEDHLKEEFTAIDKEKEVLSYLSKWREFLFGHDGVPQMDFQGDISRFLAVRSEWDQYIDEGGTALPIGWVVPRLS